MVDINVLMPTPTAWRGYGGCKSPSGDVRPRAQEGVRFYTHRKSIMQRWPEGVSKGSEFLIRSSPW